jgi:hypothetical protein
VETKQLVLGETQGALHRIPNHPQERKVGCGSEAGLLPIDYEARLDQQRESLLQVDHAVVEGGPQDQDVIQVKDGTNTLTTQLGLDLLRARGWKEDSKIRIKLKEKKGEKPGTS